MQPNRGWTQPMTSSVLQQPKQVDPGQKGSLPVGSMEAWKRDILDAALA